MSVCLKAQCPDRSAKTVFADSLSSIGSCSELCLCVLCPHPIGGYGQDDKCQYSLGHARQGHWQLWNSTTLWVTTDALSGVDGRERTKGTISSALIGICDSALAIAWSRIQLGKFKRLYWFKYSWLWITNTKLEYSKLFQWWNVVELPFNGQLSFHINICLWN